MSTHSERLAHLRETLAAQGLDGFVVPLTDEHMSEYVGGYAQRLGWLTGFEGSAGSAVVLADQAAIFTDGRYTLQVREQVSGEDWSFQSVPEASVAGWTAEHARRGARIGYDPWLHGRDWVASARAILAARDITLVPVTANPIDAVWEGRPAPSAAPLIVQDDALAGRSAADKRTEIAAWLAERGADATVVSALDSLAWAFNIRGADVDRTPVALGYALINVDGTADLFVDPAKLTDEVRRHLGNAVRLHGRDAFADGLGALSGKTVAVDPERAAAAITERLAAAGATILDERDPIVLAKAVKNPAEIAGTRAAHLRDGAALTRFLHWLSVEAPKSGLDELAAAERLQAFREETGFLKDLSFDTISAAGPNAAIPHYRVSAASSRPIEPGIYLVDSGGQYADGTTDVTRTIAVGEPTPEMRDRFTRVLKGHIALAMAVFPEGTRGVQLDTLARQHLWAAGVDYMHGTGHGVGSFLSVHEGPQRIAPAWSSQPGGDEPLLPGMILSNEPGYYKAGAWGIRIENLVLVEHREVPGGEGPSLGFETLTFAPIDRALIDPAMLTPFEREWLDSYHADVIERIGPQLPQDARAWLEVAAAPL